MPNSLRFIFVLLALAASALLAAPATAEDEPSRRVMVGGGLKTVPTYPGASSSRLTFFPEIEVWRDGEPMPAESPDEGISFAVLGKRGAIAVGPTLTFAETRSAKDLPGLPEVKFGVELGGFLEGYLGKHLRLRVELRQGIGAHRAVVGDIAADLVLRRGPEGAVATLGPRLRWGSGKHNRRYFGVPAVSVVPALPAHDPGSGIYAAGAMAGLHLPINRTWGLFSFAGYDRLIGRVSRSPLVAAGSKDQFSAGLALTYQFSL